MQCQPRAVVVARPHEHTAVTLRRRTSHPLPSNLTAITNHNGSSSASSTPPASSSSSSSSPSSSSTSSSSLSPSNKRWPSNLLPIQTKRSSFTTIVASRRGSGSSVLSTSSSSSSSSSGSPQQQQQQQQMHRSIRTPSEPSTPTTTATAFSTAAAPVTAVAVAVATSTRVDDKEQVSPPAFPDTKDYRFSTLHAIPIPVSVHSHRIHTVVSSTQAHTSPTEQEYHRRISISGAPTPQSFGYSPSSASTTSSPLNVLHAGSVPSSPPSTIASLATPMHCRSTSGHFHFATASVAPFSSSRSIVHSRSEWLHETSSDPDLPWDVDTPSLSHHPSHASSQQHGSRRAEVGTPSSPSLSPSNGMFSPWATPNWLSSAQLTNPRPL